MLYIALILALATVTYFALVAIKRGRDYNGLLEKYADMSDICSAWQKNSNKLNRKLNDKEAYSYFKNGILVSERSVKE